MPVATKKTSATPKRTKSTADGDIKYVKITLFIEQTGRYPVDVTDYLSELGYDNVLSRWVKVEEEITPEEFNVEFTS